MNRLSSVGSTPFAPAIGVAGTILERDGLPAGDVEWCDPPEERGTEWEVPDENSAGVA